MPSRRNRIVILCALIGAAWAASVALGLSRLWTYESTAGDPAQPPPTWPAATRVARVEGLPTLVLLVHPHCPCSRATVGELAKLMTDCRGKLSATALLLRPAGMSAGWERTDLWDSAAAIPGVTVLADDGGAEARRFGAATSGQVLLYGGDGRLLFAGGITESRGHAGDNAGRSAVEALILGTALGRQSGQPEQAASVAQTPVYGCPLFDESSACLKADAEGKATCHMK